MRTFAVLLSACVMSLVAVGSAKALPGWRTVPAPGVGLTAVSAGGRWDAWAVNGPKLYRYDRAGWTFRRSITGATLADINVDSASDGWAVGSKGTNAFVLRLTSSDWHTWPTPQPAGSGFTAVDAESPTDAWAVGSAGPATLAEHWDGATWSIVPTPVLPGPAVLRSVAVAAVSDVWAVGDYTDPDAFEHSRVPLIEHWDGTTWTRVPTHITPDYSDGFQDYFLRDVAVAGGRAWVVGDQQAYHIDRSIVERWNGTRWSNLSVPAYSGSSGNCNDRPLVTVSAVSASNIWAFGRCWDEFQRTYFSEATSLHFAGGSWNWTTLPGPYNQQAVSGSTTIPGTQRMWAVGSGSLVDEVTGDPLSGGHSLVEFGP
jgi:hypothetical protein